MSGPRRRKFVGPTISCATWHGGRGRRTSADGPFSAACETSTDEGGDMALELELKGKVAIISGGSDGMGRAAAERLASEGVKVGICARRKDHLERAAEEIRKATGGEVLAVPADVSR